MPQLASCKTLGTWPSQSVCAASNLYALNLFAREPRKMQEGLFSALKRFVGSAAIKKRAYNRAWKKCATH